MPSDYGEDTLQRSIRPHILIVDEVGYTRLTAEQAHQLFELVTARYEHGRCQ